MKSSVPYIFIVCALLLALAQRTDDAVLGGQEPENAEAVPVVVAAVIPTPKPMQTPTPMPKPTPVPTPEPTPTPEPPEETPEPEADEEPEVDPERLEMLACVIYSEVGGNACDDLTRFRCGDVVLTRELDPRFPDTMEEVLTAELQFGRWHWTGIVWPERASREDEAEAVQRAYDTAKALLLGEHSDLWAQGYVWMAEFPQGSDIIYADGVYFGR